MQVLLPHDFGYPNRRINRLRQLLTLLTSLPLLVPDRATPKPINVPAAVNDVRAGQTFSVVLCGSGKLHGPTTPPSAL